MLFLCRYISESWRRGLNQYISLKIIISFWHDFGCTTHWSFVVNWHINICFKNLRLLVSLNKMMLKRLKFPLYICLIDIQGSILLGFPSQNRFPIFSQQTFFSSLITLFGDKHPMIIIEVGASIISNLYHLELISQVLWDWEKVWIDLRLFICYVRRRGFFTFIRFLWNILSALNLSRAILHCLVHLLLDAH